LKNSRFLFSGTAAGAVSAFSFAVIHDLFISDIWSTLPVLLFAGALCGLCLGWTYGLLFEAPSLSTWVQYNALYVGMFVLLGGVSFLVFEPVTTMAELLVLNGPPHDLIRQALPMTVIFTIAMAAIIGRLYARSWGHCAAVLLTSVVLVLLLGLNVSAIGLVEMPSSSLYLIGEMAGLILALNWVFALVFIGLEWKTFGGAVKPLYLPSGKR
jgi:hypothetical protein